MCFRSVTSVPLAAKNRQLETGLLEKRVNERPGYWLVSPERAYSRSLGEFLNVRKTKLFGRIHLDRIEVQKIVIVTGRFARNGDNRSLFASPAPHSGQDESD